MASALPVEAGGAAQFGHGAADGVARVAAAGAIDPFAACQDDVVGQGAAQIQRGAKPTGSAAVPLVGEGGIDAGRLQARRVEVGGLRAHQVAVFPANDLARQAGADAVHGHRAVAVQVPGATQRAGCGVAVHAIGAAGGIVPVYEFLVAFPGHEVGVVIAVVVQVKRKPPQRARRVP